jgi:hypothetical protein
MRPAGRQHAVLHQQGHKCCCCRRRQRSWRPCSASDRRGGPVPEQPAGRHRHRRRSGGGAGRRGGRRCIHLEAAAQDGGGGARSGQGQGRRRQRRRRRRQRRHRDWWSATQGGAKGISDGRRPLESRWRHGCARVEAEPQRRRRIIQAGAQGRGGVVLQQAHCARRGRRWLGGWVVQRAAVSQKRTRLAPGGREPRGGPS